MKRSTLLLVTVVACVTIPWTAMAQQRRAGWMGGQQSASGKPGPHGMGMMQGQLGRQGGTGPRGVTDPDAKIDLVRMWEEEKLARDVYTRLADSTGLRLFQNISRSESQHMQALARTMQTRQVGQTQLNETPGVFRFPDYQELYQTLVAEGSRGPLEALMVGAKIEEMDIADLQRLTASTSAGQLKGVLQRLLSGSYNHLRAFNSQLTAMGGSYTPQFLTQQQYDQIVGGQSGQRGPGNARGNRAGQGAGQGAGQNAGQNAGLGQFRQGAGPAATRGGQGAGQGRGRRGR